MVTAPDLPMTMKVYSATGSFIMEYPWFTNLQVLDCINDVPSFTFNWALNKPGASNLISDSALQMAVCMDKRDGNGFTEVARYLYEQDTYDQAMAESAIVQASGRGIVALLDQAIVYPQGGVGSTTTSYSFTGSSPGAIMYTLITAAKARGCFPSLNMSFTSGQDSSGNAWAHGFTNSFQAGTSLLTLLTTLAQGGLCDFNMSGSTLNLYNPNTTLGTDRSTTVFLRRGREVETMPAQRDRTQLGTVMLAIGDNGLNVERTASTLGSLGRYEKYLQQSGVTDTSTLDYWADQALGAIDDQQIAYTPGYVCDVNKGTPVPWKDYFPGDYVSVDLNGTGVKYRARQWAVQCAPGGPTQIQPTLNDVFYDQNVLVQGKMNALNGGTVTGIASVVNQPGPNPTVPGVPAFQLANTYTAAYYSPATGTTLSQIELQWSTPTNTDGTTMIDGLQYIVQYKLSTTPIYPLAWSQLQGKSWSSINGNPWTNPLATPQNTQWTTVTVSIDNNNLIVSGLICGETYDFQIACTDVSGNTGAFSATTAIATAKDSVAPVTPDAPTVSASMVAVQVMSDLGSASGGTYNLAQDLDHLEVHYSYEPNFTAVAGVGSPTYLGKLIANAGMMAAGIAAVGTFQVTSTTGIYIRVIAVDETGNSSPASASAGVTAVLIDDTHISSLNVSKLLAGTVSATIILGGTIETASSGQRAIMDMNGFHAYNANGFKIFDVSPASTTIVLASGVGGNEIAVDCSGNYPTVYLFDVTGTKPAFFNAVEFGSQTGAGIGINSAQYTSSYDGSTVGQRLFLQGPTGAQIQVINNSQNIHGGYVDLTDTDAYLGVQTNAVRDGGYVDLSRTQALYGLFPSGATHGGQLLMKYDSGSGDCSWEIDGYKTNAGGTSPGNAEGPFGGRIDGLTATTTSVSWGWGVTLFSQPIIVANPLCITTSPVPSHMVTANTTTTFGFQASTSFGGAWSIFFWAWRYR